MITSEEIQDFIRDENISQEELARMCGVSQPTVSRWLRGATPDPLQQERLRAVIGGGAVEDIEDEDFRLRAHSTHDGKLLVELKVTVTAEEWVALCNHVLALSAFSGSKQ
jgi:transcriptional regulator with XRE-family HTH domain